MRNRPAAAEEAWLRRTPTSSLGLAANSDVGITAQFLEAALEFRLTTAPAEARLIKSSAKLLCAIVYSRSLLSSTTFGFEKAKWISKTDWTSLDVCKVAEALIVLRRQE